MPPSSSSVAPVRSPAPAHLAAFLALAALFCLSAVGLGRHPLRASAPAPPEPILLHAELRSWVVAGRGRHLYLQIDALPHFPDLRPRVEFTSASLRWDYDPASDSTGRPRVARMTPGHTLAPPPFAPLPDNRLEATYTLTIAQARALQRDRLFTEPYVLLGANSSSGLRRAMEAVGLTLPPRILRSAGILGEFPGIDIDPGPELNIEQWPSLGLTAKSPR